MSIRATGGIDWTMRWVQDAEIAMKIAILDDDPVLLDSVARLLAGEGHTCQGFAAGNPLMQALRSEHFDLFVLDWNLPDISGLSIVEWIRNHLGPAVPVLMLTSHSSEEDIVAGFRAGADDFVSKPFLPAVLSARVAALARRAHLAVSGEPTERHGIYAFDLATRTLTMDGKPVELTAKEFQLALLLFRSVDRAVSRTHILETIWGMRADVPTRTLDSHITRLRTKLTLRPENGYQLVSVYGFGYRLEGIVRTP